MGSIVSALRFPSLSFGRKQHTSPNDSELSAEGETASGITSTHVGDQVSALGAIKDFVTKERKGVPSRVPLLHRLTLAKQVQVLSIVIAILLILSVAAFGISIQETRVKREQLSVVNDMQVLSQKIAALAQRAASGDSGAFKSLDDARERLAAGVRLLIQGGDQGSIDRPIEKSSENAPLIEIAESWKRLDERISTVSEQQQNLVQLPKSEEVLTKTAPRVFVLTQQLMQGSVGRGEDVRSAAWARQLYADIVEIDLVDAASILSTDRANPQAAIQFAANVGRHLGTLKGLLEGNPQTGIGALQHSANRETATALLKAVADLKSSVDTIVRNMQGLLQAKQAAKEISHGAPDLLAKLDALASDYREEGSGWWWTGAGIALAVLALLGFALVAKTILDDVRARGARSESENRRNEQAILRLLDDMSDLAGGDLTKHALVTEDVTGAIADSVNYAIDQLRSLVSQINEAAGQLGESSSQGRTVSGHLLQVADKQSNQIQEATASVLHMASTMDAVSETASKCAGVAEQSLSASSKGTGAVQDSISGMNTLREQIQETSKRIKRLGESSQEIGEIVQLISGITEQTNVLALNAAIQAAAAGEAGRGFTVVAEEVQRLAERSGEATKQIGTIVKTIQNDTQDAVAAMEKSTQGVVQGAQLVDSAGRALGEIRAVSQQLAELVASISTSTQSQQQVAKHLAQRMQDILSITTQSSKGTKWTAESMAQISDLAQKLKVSVSGFKV
jgi:twitching motility protein PilJ